MKTFRIHGIEFNLNDDLHKWWTTHDDGPQMIWEGHEDMYAEMGSFIHFCKTNQYPVFLDIGANCGSFSAMYCKLTNIHEAHAIEPVLFHTNQLSQMAIDNNFNLHVHQLALNEYTKDGYYTGNHMAVFTDNISDNPIKIDTLDNFVDNNNIKPNLIKIDVEGYEIPVLRKSYKTIHNNNTDLFIETHRNLTRDNGYNIEEICEHITPNDYICYSCDLVSSINNFRNYDFFVIENLCDYVLKHEFRRFIAINKNNL